MQDLFQVMMDYIEYNKYYPEFAHIRGLEEHIRTCMPLTKDKRKEITPILILLEDLYKEKEMYEECQVIKNLLDEIKDI